MYNCILFDIDGTILDTKYASLYAAQSAIKELCGKDLELCEFERTFGVPTEVSAEFYGIKIAQDYVKSVDKFYEKYSLEYNRIFEGILETIESLLKKKVEIGIVTSKTLWEFDFEFDRFDLKKYFKHCIYAELTKKHKPNPEPILRYFEISETNNQNALYIGDTIYDFECADKAGIDFAFANWSGNITVNKGKYILNSPLEILDL